MTYYVVIDEKRYRVEVTRQDGPWRCIVDGREVSADLTLIRANVLSLIVDEVSYEVKRETIGSETYLWIGNTRYRVGIADPRSFQSRRSSGRAAEGTKTARSPHRFCPSLPLHFRPESYRKLNEIEIACCFPYVDRRFDIR